MFLIAFICFLFSLIILFAKMVADRSRSCYLCHQNMFQQWWQTLAFSDDSQRSIPILECNGYKYKLLNHLIRVSFPFIPLYFFIFPWVSHGFPIAFPWVSHSFPMGFPCVSNLWHPHLCECWAAQVPPGFSGLPRFIPLTLVTGARTSRVWLQGESANSRAD